MSVDMVTAELVRKMVIYDPETGVFTRRARPVGGNKVAGTVMGKTDTHGHRQIRVGGRAHMAHRVAWLYMTGEWPRGHMDHINGIRDDNRWVNLRDVTHQINCQNRRTAPKNSTTGFLGVSKSGRRFVARMRINGTPTHLGTYDSPEAAQQAYIDAKRTHHQGCTL